MSIDPGHRGALDIYVPLVDWGARFEAIKAPVRVRVDLQTIDREIAQGLAEGKSLNVEQVRDEARAALKAYLMKLFALILASALALGLLVAFAIRSHTPRLRWTSGVAVLTTAGGSGAREFARSSNAWICSSVDVARRAATGIA